MTFERREVHFSGRVQGVGFRYTTRRLASGRDVTGFVKNLPDSGVLLVVEGSTSDIDALVAEIREAMGDHIHDMRSLKSDHQGTFHDFRIEF